jgi:large repetitive protein
MLSYFSAVPVVHLVRSFVRRSYGLWTLLLVAVGASSAFAQVGFAPGCGPFRSDGTPNIANFTSGNQIVSNFPIPGSGLGFGLATQIAGCAPYTYRLAPTSAPLPAGVTFAAGPNPAIPSVFFSGTPTGVLQNSTVTIEVSANGVNWATGASVTLNVVSCLSWRGGNNQRYRAIYSPTAINVDRGIIARPVAGVPYDTTVTLIPNAYPAAAYCAVPEWEFRYDGEATPGASGLTATSVAGSNLAVRILGTPTASGVSPEPCDDPDGGPNAQLGSGEGATFPTTLDFCFAADGPAPTLAVIGSPPGGQVNSPYTFTFTTNPTAPASFSLLSGTLPPGLGLTSAGVVSGTPTAPGTYNFSLQANAGAAGTANGSFAINILPITIPPAQPATNVPTLSQWALMALAVACAMLVRRRLKG